MNDFVSCLLVLCLVALGTGSFAAEPAQEGSGCISRPVSFDGTEPLRYYAVAGKKDGVPLSLEKPSGCGSRERGVSCGKSVLLKEGAVVAVGKTCGGRAYVQYIGPDHVFVGWTDAKSLVLLPGKKPLRKGDNSSPPVFHFKLIRGSGVPVCEAYLQRLNVTTYKKDSWGNSSPPYCDRGEDDTVDGFTALHRVSFDADEIVAWSRRIWNFETGECPSSDEFCQRRTEGTGPVIPRSLVVNLLGHTLAAWKYESELDIENNGNPDGLLVWFGGWGAGSTCGGGYEFAGKEIRDAPRPQHIYVLDPTGKRIKDEKTLAIFGEPGAKWGHRPKGNKPPFPGSWLLGVNMQPFEYRGVYYFDAAVVEVKNQEAGDMTPHELDVYERRQNDTDLICKVGLTLDYKQH